MYNTNLSIDINKYNTSKFKIIKSLNHLKICLKIYFLLNFYALK